jgi:hypothetical protein
MMSRVEEPQRGQVWQVMAPKVCGAGYLSLTIILNQGDKILVESTSVGPALPPLFENYIVHCRDQQGLPLMIGQSSFTLGLLIRVDLDY